VGEETQHHKQKIIVEGTPQPEIVQITPVNNID